MPKLALTWSRPAVHERRILPFRPPAARCRCATPRACAILGCEQELKARVLAALTVELDEKEPA